MKATCVKFIVSKEIFERYPDAVIGVVVAKNINNAGSSDEIQKMLEHEQERIRNDFNLENLAQNLFIQNWRKAYKLFGSDERCSSERLIRRALKGEQLPSVNKLVDIYNQISLKYRTPVGGEDIDNLKGNVYLRFATGKETFVAIGSRELQNIKEGEVIYADEKEVICRRWNLKESDNTKLTEQTKNAFLVIDALPPVLKVTVQEANEELASLVSRHCGAKTSSFIIDRTSTEIEL